jgi:hypothetical protein
MWLMLTKVMYATKLDKWVDFWKYRNAGRRAAGHPSPGIDGKL